MKKSVFNYLIGEHWFVTRMFCFIKRVVRSSACAVQASRAEMRFICWLQHCNRSRTTTGACAGNHTVWKSDSHARLDSCQSNRTLLTLALVTELAAPAQIHTLNIQNNHLHSVFQPSRLCQNHLRLQFSTTIRSVCNFSRSVSHSLNSYRSPFCVWIYMLAKSLYITCPKIR